MEAWFGVPTREGTEWLDSISTRSPAVPHVSFPAPFCSALVTGRGSSLASTWPPCQAFCWHRGTLFATPDEPGKPIRKHTYLGPHAKPSQQEAIFSRCGPSLCLIGATKREPWVTSRQVALTWISPLPEAATPVTAVGVSLAGRQAGKKKGRPSPSLAPMTNLSLCGF